jgi:signal transduction histidine kinase
LARSKGKNIKTDITPMLSYNGDESSIRQVVGILLDNAIKYARTDDNGKCRDIEVTLEKKNKNIVLLVSNSSEAVSEEQLRHFFDRFYRTEQSDKSGEGGYGLGLSIAKAIVEKHKGRISASAPDTQTVQITVTLPINH